MNISTPTEQTYSSLTRAFDFFNERLFQSTLPPCLVTLQRKNQSLGYFAGGRFGSKDGVEITDEIALNPSHFRSQTTEDTLSTLVHEMAHLWQHHLGKKPRAGYHDKQWAAKMHEIGLIPSNTAAPGGKETGQKMSHYIAPGGPFQTAFAELDEAGFDDLYVERWADADTRKNKAKAASKTRFACPSCPQKAWAKSSARFMCCECEAVMEAA